MIYKITIYLVTLLIVSILCSCVGSHHQPYPSDWPQYHKIKDNCEQLSGVYNARPSFYGQWEPHVWNFLWANRLTAKTEIERNILLSNEISLYFDINKTLHIDYLVDKKMLTSKNVVSSEYTCEQGVLQFTKSYRSGKQIYDKVSNYGTHTEYLELFRIDNYLYAKELSKSTAVAYYLIPMFFNDSSSVWYRFGISQPRN